MPAQPLIYLATPANVPATVTTPGATFKKGVSKARDGWGYFFNDGMFRKFNSLLQAQPA